MSRIPKIQIKHNHVSQLRSGFIINVAYGIASDMQKTFNQGNPIFYIEAPLIEWVIDTANKLLEANNE